MKFHALAKSSGHVEFLVAGNRPCPIKEISAGTPPAQWLVTVQDIWHALSRSCTFPAVGNV